MRDIKDQKHIAKMTLRKVGVKIYQKDILQIIKIKSESIGHVYGWTKDTYKISMKDGHVYTMTSTPSGIYSALIENEIVGGVE